MLPQNHEPELWTSIAVALAIALAGCSIPDLQIKWKGQPEPEYHAHADIKVIIMGQELDFNKAEYMSDERNQLAPHVHMHYFNPHVIHFHSPDATLGDFFASLGMSIDSACFYNGKEKYCSNGTENLLVYVNGNPLFLNYGNYVPRDLDRILVYYGLQVPGQKLVNSVTGEACIYSKRCLPPPGFKVEEEPCTIGQPCTLPGT